VHAEVLTPHIQAKAAIVIDAKTGQVLSTKNENMVLPAASTSKLLTAYLVEKAISEKKLSWNTQVKITANIAKVSTEPELTNVPLKAGASYRVIDLYHAALLDSANAAAMALGHAVSGSQAQFVALMQDQLKEWGINDYQIYGAAGLLNSQIYGDAVGGNRHSENMLSVADMAIIARHLVNDYPDVLKTTELRNAKFGNAALKSTNELLHGGKVKTKYHFDGLKTGASNKAHGNFVGTLTYKHRRLITVIFGAGKLNPAIDPSRFIQTNQLLDQTLPNFKYVEQADTQPQETINVPNAVNREVTLVIKEPIGMWLAKDAKGIVTKAHQTVKLKAPFNSYQKVGKVTVENQASYLPGVNEPEYTLVTGHSAKRVGFWTMLVRQMKSFF
jgi:D-alanyl-D-alanine carboxypeptidase (penicillin-binding protein 5/6)